MKKHTSPTISATQTKTGQLKSRHRHADGSFKTPPGRGNKPLAPASLDQDSGQGYNPHHENIQK
jgi:hypothetical protein